LEDNVIFIGQSIPHRLHRYPTLGDWAYGPNYIEVSVSETGNDDYSFLLFIHEMIEAYLCKKAGISGQQVDNWDKTHLYSDDPGSLPDCPYAEQHFRAEGIESLLASYLGINWRSYGEFLIKFQIAQEGEEG
jgi:hypothetical protein